MPHSYSLVPHLIKSFINYYINILVDKTLVFLPRIMFTCSKGLKIHFYIVQCSLNIHGTHVTANNSTNNNVVFFFVSDLQIVYYNNYQSLIPMFWTRQEKYFALLFIWRQNHSKLCKQNFVGSLTKQLSLEKPNLFLGTQWTTSTNRQKIPDLAGSWLQDILTMWIRWEIISEGVRKSLSVELGLSRAQ